MVMQSGLHPLRRTARRLKPSRRQGAPASASRTGSAHRCRSHHTSATPTLLPNVVSRCGSHHMLVVDCRMHAVHPAWRSSSSRHGCWPAAACAGAGQCRAGPGPMDARQTQTASAVPRPHTSGPMDRRGACKARMSHPIGSQARAAGLLRNACPLKCCAAGVLVNMLQCSACRTHGRHMCYTVLCNVLHESHSHQHATAIVTRAQGAGPRVPERRHNARAKHSARAAGRHSQVRSTHPQQGRPGAAPQRPPHTKRCSSAPRHTTHRCCCCWRLTPRRRAHPTARGGGGGGVLRAAGSCRSCVGLAPQQAPHAWWKNRQWASAPRSATRASQYAQSASRGGTWRACASVGILVSKCEGAGRGPDQASRRRLCSSAHQRSSRTRSTSTPPLPPATGMGHPPGCLHPPDGLWHTGSNARGTHTGPGQQRWWQTARPRPPHRPAPLRQLQGVSRLGPPHDVRVVAIMPGTRAPPRARCRDLMLVLGSHSATSKGRGGD